MAAKIAELRAMRDEGLAVRDRDGRIYLFETVASYVVLLALALIAGLLLALPFLAIFDL